MALIEQLGLSALRCLDPERAHGLALRALAAGLAGGSGPVTSDRLRVTLAGISLPNPVGVAAGFDKNAVAPDATLRAGFGFCEIGAVTPRPQPGNPKRGCSGWPRIGRRSTVSGSTTTGWRRSTPTSPRTARMAWSV